MDYEEWTEISELELARDAILFGLRMNQGINVNEICEKFTIDPFLFSEIIAFLDALVNEELAIGEGNNYRLTNEGRIRCDAIACELPELSTFVESN